MSISAAAATLADDDQVLPRTCLCLFVLFLHFQCGQATRRVWLTFHPLSVYWMDVKLTGRINQETQCTLSAAVQSQRLLQAGH